MPCIFLLQPDERETRALEFPHFISPFQRDQPYVDDSGNGLQQIA